MTPVRSSVLSVGLGRLADKSLQSYRALELAESELAEEVT
jgi:hypothetical protein